MSGNVTSTPFLLGNCANIGQTCGGTSGGNAWCCVCQPPVGTCPGSLWTCAYLANPAGCPASEPASGSACTQPAGNAGCSYCPGGALHPLRCASSSNGSGSVWTENWIGLANCF